MSVKLKKYNSAYSDENGAFEKAVIVEAIVTDIGSDEITWIDSDTEYEYRAKLVVVKREQDPLYRDKDWLYEQYITNELSCASIGKMFGASPMAIYKWLKKHDIPTRPRGRVGNNDN